MDSILAAYGLIDSNKTAKLDIIMVPAYFDIFGVNLQ
jgi:hypothetical protein